MTTFEVLEVLCPHDGRVLDVMVRPSTRVRAGEQLLSLSADDAGAHAQVVTFERLVAVQDQMLSDPQLAPRRAVVTATLTFCREQHEFCKRVHDYVTRQRSLGLTSQDAVLGTELALAKTGTEHEQARLAVELLEMEIQVARERLGLLRERVSFEKSSLEQRAALVAAVYSPSGGTIDIDLKPGDFVRTGMPLARITK